MSDSLRSITSRFFSRLLLALLIVSFAVWGIGDMVSGRGSNITVAKIGKMSITQTELQQAIHRETENIRQALGDRFSPEMIRQFRVVERVLQKKITHALLQQEAQALGLIPSDADVVRRIRNNPNWQDKSGNFSKDTFESMLARSRLSEKAYVEQLRQDIAVNLLLDTMASSLSVPTAAVDTLHAVQNETRNVIFYMLGESLVAGKIAPPDDATLEAFYKEHGKAFNIPEYRTLSYVTIGAEQAASTKQTVSEDMIQAAYKEHIDEFKRPERRVVEQLLYATEDLAKVAVAELDAGKTMEQVARNTQVQNKNALSLGAVTRDTILELAAEAVFSMEVGGHTAPIQSPFGWHIFVVKKIEPPSIAPLEEVRERLSKELAERAAEESLTMISNKLEDAIAGGSTLKEAADSLGLITHSLAPITAEGKTQAGILSKELPALDKFLEVAFKTEEKSESSMTASKGGVYYIVRVDSITPEHTRPLGEVRAQVVAAWQAEERRKSLAKLAQEIAQAMVEPSKQSEIVTRYKLSGDVIAGIKRDSAKAGSITLPTPLMRDIFSRKPGQATEAYAIDDGHYLIAVVKQISQAPRENESTATAEKILIRTQLEQSMKNEITEQYLRHLEQKYSISIHQAALDALNK